MPRAAAMLAATYARCQRCYYAPCHIGCHADAADADYRLRFTPCARHTRVYAELRHLRAMPLLSPRVSYAIYAYDAATMSLLLPSR